MTVWVRVPSSIQKLNSQKCSRGYSTLNNRENINKNVSNTLKGRKVGGCFKKGFDENRFVITSEISKKINQQRKDNIEKKILNSDYDELKVLDHKKRKVLIEQNFVCDECKLNKWNDKPLALEFHHKDGNKKNNNRENVQYLCPNCHSQTDTWRNMKRNGPVPQLVQSGLPQKQNVMGSSPIGVTKLFFVK